jgi:hypothetical protein
MTSTAVTLIVVIADIALVAILLGGLAYAARAERRPAVLWIGGAGVIAAFAVAFGLARGGAFETTPSSTMPPAIAGGILVPTLLGCALLAFAPVRSAIARVPLHWLVGVQFYRIVGGVFLIALAQGDVPAEFALPAGIGDVLVGLAAPFIAAQLAADGVERAWGWVAGWCVLGLLDLVVAVGAGMLTAPSVIQQLALENPNAAITSYPLVLIPTFAVPASIVLHVYVLARLRRAPQPATQPGIA